MKIFGITVVRNEVDIIRLSVLYHLALGLDRILIVDNGSTDGTSEAIQQLARDKPVSWTRLDSEFYQAQITTERARHAFHEGADWVLPFDADEFWYAPSGDFRSILTETQAGALRVSVLHYIQSRERYDSTPDALLTMTRRARDRVYPHYDFYRLLEANQIAFVETLYPAKWISRASATMEIKEGNHEVTNVPGPFKATADLICLHAPLRSRARLAAKAETGRRLDAAGEPPHRGLYARRFKRLEEAGEFDQEWEANSYASDSLNVYGIPHPLVFDPTLRDAVAPFIQHPLQTACACPVEGEDGRRPEQEEAEQLAQHPERTARARFLTQDVMDDLFHRFRMLQDQNTELASWTQSLTDALETAERYAREVEARFHEVEHHWRQVEQYARHLEREYLKAGHHWRQVEQYTYHLESEYHKKVAEIAALRGEEWP